jgi:Flp pilus assembly pilin Flp
MIANLISSSRRDDGQALVEYALVLSLVSLVTVGALTLLGTNVTTALNTIGTAL